MFLCGRTSDLVVRNGGDYALQERREDTVHKREAPAKEVRAFLLAQLLIDLIHACDEVTLPFLMVPEAVLRN